MTCISDPAVFATEGAERSGRRALSVRSCGPPGRPVTPGKALAGKGGNTGSRFGRGRSAALALSLRSPSRRVVIKARVVRHRGHRFRSAPLTKHVTYLKRDGVTRDGADARLFDAKSDVADERAFAERCEDDRHHFRFIISPEDARRHAAISGRSRAN